MGYISDSLRGLFAARRPRSRPARCRPRWA